MTMKKTVHLSVEVEYDDGRTTPEAIAGFLTDLIGVALESVGPSSVKDYGEVCFHDVSVTKPRRRK